jgi:MoxR-like ATPase
MSKILTTYNGNQLNEANNALGLDVYIPSPELIEAVNLALLLHQPLLLMGEPGCGKTRLAEAVAAELHGKNWKDHYFRWDIKSSSKAKDGIYQYDALRRLYDANSQNADAADIAKYVTYGKFVKALTQPQNSDKPNILLIDEIDKADIDFPNDLLLEIEKGEFFIPESKETIVGTSNVLIFVTSNRERELPPAFLRRCLYHYIDFPTSGDLIEIVSKKFGKKNNDALVAKAIKLFEDIREDMETKFASADKKPATSELLKWFEAINYYKLEDAAHLTDTQKEFIRTIEDYEKEHFESMKIPFRQVLLKTYESNHLFSKAREDAKK